MALDEDQVCAYFSGCNSGDKKDMIHRIGFLLCKIKDKITEIIALLTAGVLPAEERVVTSSIISVTGSIPAGAQSLLLEFSDDFTGTVAGAAVDGSVTATRSISAKSSDTLGAVAVVVTTGTITVTRVD